MDYFAAHPDAQDTLEGIVEWWMLEQQIKWSKSHIQEALDELVADGLLVERRSAERSPFYQLNANKSKKRSGRSKKGRPRRGRRSE